MPVSFALAPLAVTVLRMLAEQSTDPDERAGLLLSLVSHLARLGNRPESLAAAKEAVKIRRDLARDDPDTFLPALAMSLNNQGWCLNKIGRPGKALAAAAEAIKIRLDLIEEHPEIRPGLAAALNNKAVSLTALHRPEEALTAAEEARSIYRGLAQDRPDVYLHAYATALNDLSTCLVTHADPDRRERALTASEEATRILRLLATIRGGEYLSYLAVSLQQPILVPNRPGTTERSTGSDGGKRTHPPPCWRAVSRLPDLLGVN